MNQRYQAARKLAQKIQEGVLQTPFERRDVYRKGWSFLKTRDDVDAACELLIENNWIQEESFTSFGKMCQRYRINPKLEK